MLANSRRKSKKSLKARSADTEPTNIARVCNDKPVTIILVGALKVNVVSTQCIILYICSSIIYTAAWLRPDPHPTDDKDHCGSQNKPRWWEVANRRHLGRSHRSRYMGIESVDRCVQQQGSRH
jgi:hypothetical protein